MRASRGVNLWLTQRAIALGFVCGREMPCGIATRHKGRAEAYFLLEFLFLLFQDKRNTMAECMHDLFNKLKSTSIKNFDD